MQPGPGRCRLEAPGYRPAMTEPRETTPAFGEPTDVTVDPDSFQEGRQEDGEAPTSSATQYQDGDTEGGTGGLDAGGAG